MSFFLRDGDDAAGAGASGVGRPDAFAGFAYRATEDSADLEADAAAARAMAPESPRSPRSPRPDAERWWWQRAKDRLLGDKPAPAPPPPDADTSPEARVDSADL